MSHIIDLSEYQLQRPEKIRWRVANPSIDPLDQIKSKSLRQFLRRADDVLASNDLTYDYQVLNRDTFIAWLPYYEKKMAENQYELLASPEWYDKKIAAGLQVTGLFFHKQGQLVGSGIFTQQGHDKATFAFKATDRLGLSGAKNASLGAIADYLFLKKMTDEKVAVISAGRSRNAFGVINTLGYLDYKLKFGYLPSPAENTPLLDSVPTTDQGVILFYGLKNTQLGLYAFKPRGNPSEFNVKQFATPELPFFEIEY